MYIYTHIYIHVYSYISVCMNIHVYIYVYVYIQSGIRCPTTSVSYSSLLTLFFLETYQIYIHTYIYTRIQKYIYIYIYTSVFRHPCRTHLRYSRERHTATHCNTLQHTAMSTTSVSYSSQLT